MTSSGNSAVAKRSDSAAPSGAKPSERDRDASSLILALQAHRRQPRDDAGYWDQYCSLMRALCRATTVLLLGRDETGWAVQGQECGADDWAARNWRQAIEDLGDRSLQNGYALSPMQDDAGRLRILAMVRATGNGDALLVIDIPERERGQLNEIVMRAMLASDLSSPASASSSASPSASPSPIFSSLAAVPDASVAGTAQSAAQRGGDRNNDRMFDMLDLAAQVMNEQRFGAASLLLVNGIAAHFGAAQVALGWLQGESVRTVAVSHLDRFEHNTQTVALLEEAFLETLGQPGTVWHAGGDAAPDPLLSSHAKLARLLDFSRLCSAPIADAAGARKAVVLMGFKEDLASPPAVDDLMLAMGFLQPWLHDLQQRDRWWGARLADWTRNRIARLIGPGQVWGRTAVVLASALLLFAAFGTWNYRIEALSQITTDSTRLISAQFDGKVDEVLVSAGDTVRQGALLATLDTRELRQQEMDIRADRHRFGAEADKARAAGNLAELEIAQARVAQTDARLARVLNYLAQARAVAPFDGIVVDGERKELLNAPVKKGDKLFRIARIDGLYVELLVPEREIRYVKPNATGELRLLSRPDQKIPFKLATFIPMAQVKGQEGNHFLVKAELQQAPEAWWRPGMSGIVLIDGGQQNVAWILTHKLVDALRMKLWWLW